MKQYDHLLNTRKNLIDKKLIPHSSLGIFDLGNMQKALYDYQTDPIKSRSCPHCHITIKAPNEWFRHHLKIHFRKAMEQGKVKENDTFKTDSKVYFE